MFQFLCVWERNGVAECFGFCVCVMGMVWLNVSVERNGVGFLFVCVCGMWYF